MLTFLLLSQAPAVSSDTVELRAGLIISRSVVVRPGRYLLRPIAPDSVAVRIRGTGITVGMSGVTLLGTEEDALPDAASGIGILIEGSRDISLERARIRGYKIGVLARGVWNLTLYGLDVSDNWRPRLWSGAGHESLVDWLSYHQNEKDQWLRYGAGIFLIDVEGGEVRGNLARRGMNGLQLVRSHRVRIWNNEFSWLSGLGIGLYRSTRNTIMHNRLDYCVRGYVHGVYRRGQDSAALLLYEQSSGNVVAYNSMTHSGDGVFLWAGQSTMDTGKGGANDNLFFGNDVSFAVANGIEATFSTNRFIANFSEGSEYGVWGGYSWGSEIRDNTFRANVTGVAIEHGQDNLIRGNIFERDSTAIRLWWNHIESSDWGYPKHRDTRSRDYRIESNRFSANTVAVRLENTTGVRIDRNRYAGVDTALILSGETTGPQAETSGGPASTHDIVTKSADEERRPWVPDFAHPDAPKSIPGGMVVMMPPAAVRGRATILVDEWGPYDGQRPRLWLHRAADSAYTGGPLVLRVLGPQARWRVKGTRGLARISDSTGFRGDTLVVTPEAGTVTDWSIDLESTDASRQFSYSRFVAPASWQVRAVVWDSSSDPRTSIEAFRARLAGSALVSRTERVLDYMWGRRPLPGFPAARFGVTAEGAVDLPAGDYELATISDDGIRVWVDGNLVVDRWSQHESELAIVPLSAGRHALKVEYYQVDGWVELRVEVRRIE